MPADNFRAEEAAVLQWLQEQAGVADAVDALLSGREAAALPVITKVVKAALAGAGGPSATGGPPVASAASADTSTGAIKRPAAEAPESSPAKQPKGAGPARCVCVFVLGLHGCGKSAACKILREVLGGTWLNYDEFVAKYEGKNARTAFSKEFYASLVSSLANADQNRFERFVFLDRDVVFRKERSEMMQILRKLQWKRRGGKLLLVEFCHTTDAYGYGRDNVLSMRYSDRHVALCAKRIEDRGAAHPSLHPSAKLKSSLTSVAKACEAATPEELAQFDGRVRVDVALTAPEIGLAVVEEICKLGWTPYIQDASALKHKLELAWSAYERAESQWRAGVAAAVEPDNNDPWLAQCRKALAEKKALEKEASKARQEKDKEQQQEQQEPQQQQQNQQQEQEQEPEPLAPAPSLESIDPSVVEEGPVPLFWKIDLPEVSRILTKGLLPATQSPVDHPHATLLYLGGESDDTAAAKKAALPLEQFKAMREALESLQGEEFEVRMTQIVVEQSVACAVVELPPIVPCCNKIPHVTLGTRLGVPGRHANEVLEDVKAGRRDGITVIPLPTPRALRGRLLIEYSRPAMTY